ncbi:MAG: putative glycoside hydrolase [Clostridia bacterium]|nr:putative glycoside hydrolase [Clostridia bacterium]
MYKNKKVIFSLIVLVAGIGAAILLFVLSGTDKNAVLVSKQDESTQINTSQQEKIPLNRENEEKSDNKSADKENIEKSDKHIKTEKVKAVYYTGVFAGIEKRLDHIIEVIKSTELNAIVIDIKEAGKVNYESKIPEVKNNGLFTKFYNPEKVIKKLHDNNIYVIGRIVCFRDDGLASKRADLAIKTPKGTLWREYKNKQDTKWTNPFNQDVWKYNIDIAKEAIDIGFDEIQFDYVRFPTAGSKEVDYGIEKISKADAICGFLRMASEELREKKGVPVSADIFGIVCVSPKDGNSIGQVIERVGMDIDYICPMVYPSHYANAGKGIMGNGVGQKINGVNFTAPDLKPYDVVYNTLIEAGKKIAKVQGYKAKMRPYLQDFTATYIKNKKYYQEYGIEQIKQQIKAVYDAGYEEWILWDGKNTYTEEALVKE